MSEHEEEEHAEDEHEEEPPQPPDSGGEHAAEIERLNAEIAALVLRIAELEGAIAALREHTHESEPAPEPEPEPAPDERHWYFKRVGKGK